jgi:hypothetical protein
MVAIVYAGHPDPEDEFGEIGVFGKVRNGGQPVTVARRAGREIVALERREYDLERPQVVDCICKSRDASTRSGVEGAGWWHPDRGTTTNWFRE